MKISEVPLNTLADMRTAASEAISAIAWLDLMVADVQGLRQAGHEWSAAAEVLRKVQLEEKRRGVRVEA